MKRVIDISKKRYETIKRKVNNPKRMIDEIDSAIATSTPLPKCKECKFFEYDFIPKAYSPLILGHEVCMKWGDGCKTKEDGYCFLFEAKEGEEDADNNN